MAEFLAAALFIVGYLAFYIWMGPCRVCGGYGPFHQRGDLQKHKEDTHG